MTVKSVDILLSTYNGEKFLQQQIDSLLNQTCPQINIIIRDDGSTDSTIDIISRICAQDKRVRFIDDTLAGMGAGKSFLELLKHSEAPYIMFCDQDDVWKPEKVEISLHAISDQNQPCLAHSDLQVVDEQLNTIAESYIARSGLAKEPSFDSLLVQNNVTGCTVIFNDKLRSLALEMQPSFITMHDWWLALLASMYGTVLFIDKPLIMYRQHSNNVVGSRGLIQKVAKRFFSSKSFVSLYSNPMNQALELHRFVSDHQAIEPVSHHVKILEKFVGYNGNILRRLKFCFESHYHKSSLGRDFMFRLMFLLCYRPLGQKGTSL